MDTISRSNDTMHNRAFVKCFILERRSAGLTKGPLDMKLILRAEIKNGVKLLGFAVNVSE